MHLLAAARATALLRRWEISIMIMETRQRNHHIISCNTLASTCLGNAQASARSFQGFESARQSQDEPMAKKRERHTRARYEWEQTRRRTHNRASVRLSAPALGRALAMPEDQPLRLDRPLRLGHRVKFCGRVKIRAICSKFRESFKFKSSEPEVQVPSRRAE